jgi:hypothetical protein
MHCSPAPQQMASPPHSTLAQPNDGAHGSTMLLSGQLAHASAHAFVVQPTTPSTHTHALQPSPAGNVVPEEYVRPPCSHRPFVVVTGSNPIRPQALATSKHAARPIIRIRFDAITVTVAIDVAC